MRATEMKIERGRFVDAYPLYMIVGFLSGIGFDSGKRIISVDISTTDHHNNKSILIPFKSDLARYVVTAFNNCKSLCKRSKVALKASSMGATDMIDVIIDGHRIIPTMNRRDELMQLIAEVNEKVDSFSDDSD